MPAKRKTKKSITHHTKRHVRLAVVPHKHNNYSPHLVRSYGLLVIFLVVVGLQLGYNAATTGNILGRASNISVDSLLDQTNEARKQAGQSELALNEKLVKAAELKAQDMFANQYWAHSSPSGVEPWQWLKDVDYEYAAAGENLAKNFTSSSAIVTAWLDSPTHKANVLSQDYNEVGFAVLEGDLEDKPTSVVVALYGLPVQNAIAGEQNQQTFVLAEMPASSGILTQLGVAVQSITPAALGGLVLLSIALVVSMAAHVYRNKLPKPLRLSWRRHHGLYKSVGLASFGLVVLFLYSGGQI